jgi:hypothetical protein
MLISMLILASYGLYCNCWVKSFSIVKGLSHSPRLINSIKNSEDNLGKQELILNPIDKGYVQLAVLEPMIISQVFNFLCHVSQNTTTF